MKKGKGKAKSDSWSFWLIILGLLFLGGGCILISEIVNNQFWKVTFSNIASAIIVAGIFTAINEKLLREKLVELILSKVKLKEDIERTGIEEVFTDVSDVDYRYYIKSAKKQIDILHVYGRTWTTSNLDEIKDKLFYSNCTIRVILMSPDSPFVNGLADYYGISPEELKNRIREVTEMWKVLLDEKSKRKKKATQSTLNLYYHSGQPSSSLYRIDDRIINVQNRFSGGRSKKLPTIICKDTKNNDDLYNNLLTEIEELINLSDDINLDKPKEFQQKKEAAITITK